LQESLERRKNALHERRLALEKDVCIPSILAIEFPFSLVSEQVDICSTLQVFISIT